MDVQDLIALAVQADKAKADADAAAREAVRSQQAEMLASLLPVEVWQALHMDPLQADFASSNATMVELMGWVELAGERVQCRIEATGFPYQRGGRLVMVGLNVVVRLSDGAVGVGDALRMAAVELEKRKAEAMKRAEAKLMSAYVQDPDDAREAAATLLRYAPEQAERWQELLMAKLTLAAERDEEIAERRRTEEKQAAEEQAFRDAASTWAVQVKEVREQNREWTAAMQARADVPFSVLRLTYAVVAKDDDERYVETRSDYATLTTQETDGWFDVYSGKGSPLETWLTRYSHLVKTEKVSVVPSDRIVACMRVLHAGYALWVGPMTAREVIDEWQAGLLAEPAAPAGPEWMWAGLRWDILREALPPESDF